MKLSYSTECIYAFLNYEECAKAFAVQEDIW